MGLTARIYLSLGFFVFFAASPFLNSVETRLNIVRKDSLTHSIPPPTAVKPNQITHVLSVNPN